MLKTGDKAPDFTLASDDGKDVSLGDFQGKRLVIFFFPKANTPG
jgi:peroxiredoxin Q/BCP